jgi:hypothetical protein
MTSTAIAGIVLACVFGGALLGMSARAVLPEHHLSADTKDVVKLAIALIATVSALVLSLLISTAKGAYDTRGSELVQMSVNIVLLDRALAHYGPETKDARSLLRQSVTTAIERFWPADDRQPPGFDKAATPVEDLYDKIQELSPQTDAQRSLQTLALKATMDLGQLRFLIIEQAGHSVPTGFLVVLIFWLTVIFASFGLFAPANGTVYFVFLVCAISVAGAIFMILELDRSFEGVIQISSAPLRQALSRLGQ